MSYTDFWRKIAAMIKISLYKRDGQPFKIFADSGECLGVPYQTSWNWVMRQATPQKKTVQKVLQALNESFDICPPLTLDDLDDKTTAHEFCVRLGGDVDETDGAVLSTHSAISPLHRFGYESSDQARELLSRIRGSYVVDRTYRERRTNENDKLRLSVDALVSVDKRHFIHATMEVPSEYGESYQYDGNVCERSGLMYWVFSQKNVELHDFAFMITDRIYVRGGGRFQARGKMITMGQAQPAPFSSNIVIQRESPGCKE